MKRYKNKKTNKILTPAQVIFVDVESPNFKLKGYVTMASYSRCISPEDWNKVQKLKGI